MPATYSYDSGTDSYFVTGGCGDATIIITDTHNDGTNGTKPVTRIVDGAFLDCADLQTLVIGNNVTIIGNEAFKNCIYMTSATISNSVTTIGNSAFYSCGFLDNITMGNSVITIGTFAFYRCGFSNITLPSTLTSIGSSAFWESSITSIVIPNSVTTLEDSIFVQCGSLASLTLPSNGTINTVPQGLCVLCTSLTSITIPSNYTTIAQDAFIFAGLRNVTLNEGLLTIGLQAFYGCPLDQGEFIVPNSVTSIGVRAFEATGGARFVIGTGVTELPSHTFYNSDMTDISFRSPSSLITIGPGCFALCNLLNNLYIPDSVQNIIFQSIDQNCFPYDDPPFYNAVRQGGTVRIGSGLIFPPRNIYTTRPPTSPPCTWAYGSQALSNLGKILTNLGGTTLILGKSITSIDSTSFSGLLSFFSRASGSPRRTFIFEGRMTSIGVNTFISVSNPSNIYFNGDFTNPFSLGESRFIKFTDRVYINPKIGIRID